MKFWFTGDTHFYHKAICDYTMRPWRNVEWMNLVLIENWNSLVGPKDTVFHLGDFCFGPVDNIGSVFRKLNGNIVLIRGNHDRTKTSMKHQGFKNVFNQLVVKVDGVSLYLRHKPMETYQGAGIHLCGHVHNEWKQRGKVVNVGCDVWNYSPVSLQMIREVSGL